MAHVLLVPGCKKSENLETFENIFHWPSAFSVPPWPYFTFTLKVYKDAKTKCCICQNEPGEKRNIQFLSWTLPWFFYQHWEKKNFYWAWIYWRKIYCISTQVDELVALTSATTAKFKISAKLCFISWGYWWAKITEYVNMFIEYVVVKCWTFGRCVGRKCFEI